MLLIDSNNVDTILISIINHLQNSYIKSMFYVSNKLIVDKIKSIDNKNA